MLLRFSPPLRSLVLVAAVAAVASCGASASDAEFESAPSSTSQTGSNGALGGSSSTASLGPLDAEAFGVAPVVQGSPLCNAMAQSSCYPDTPTGQCAPAIAADAASVPADASDAGVDADASEPLDGQADAAAASDGDAGTDASAGLGCHVVETADAGITPVCSASGAGVDGDACSDSSDCAAAYECVGAGTCRPYCCSGSCDSTHFCDVQPEAHPAGAGAPVPVPVCMPVRPCALPGESNDAGRCAQGNETCAVVLAGVASQSVAVASCVQSGTAAVGESCEAEHCAAGLTCIGSWGNKICYTLCDTTDASSECAGSQVCSGGLPLFPNPTTGVCKQPVESDF